MPALTRFRLTDNTDKPGGKVRIRLYSKGAEVAKMDAPLVSSGPPQYVWQDAVGVNDVDRIQYVLDWVDPVWGERYHQSAMSVQVAKYCIQDAGIDVTRYSPPTNNPPTDDYFVSVQNCNVYCQDGTTTALPPTNGKMQYSAVDPIPIP